MVLKMPTGLSKHVGLDFEAFEHTYVMVETSDSLTTPVNNPVHLVNPGFTHSKNLFVQR